MEDSSAPDLSWINEVKDVEPAVVLFILETDTNIHTALGQPSVARIPNLTQGATPAQSKMNLLAWIDSLLLVTGECAGRSSASRVLCQDGTLSTVYHHLSEDCFLNFIQKLATPWTNQLSGECKTAGTSAGSMFTLHNQEGMLHGRHLSYGPFVSNTT